MAAHEQGASLSDLMKTFDMTMPAVRAVTYRTRKAKGQVKPHSALTKEERVIRNAEIHRRSFNGQRPCEIHRAMGISKNIVIGVLNRANG